MNIKSKKLFDEAISEQNNGDYFSIVEKLKLALQNLSPEDFEENLNLRVNILLGLSQTYHNIGADFVDQMDDEKAIVYFEKAIDLCNEVHSLASDIQSSRKLLAYAYQAAAGSYINLLNNDKAIQFLNKALTINNAPMTEIIKLLAEAYYYNDQNDEAINLLVRKGNLSHQNAKMYLNNYRPTKYSKYLVIANRFVDQGNTLKAIEYYDLAINLSPTRQIAYYDKALYLVTNNEYNEALTILERSKKLAPNGEFDLEIEALIDEIGLKLSSDQSRTNPIFEKFYLFSFRLPEDARFKCDVFDEKGEKLINNEKGIVRIYDNEIVLETFDDSGDKIIFYPKLDKLICKYVVMGNRVQVEKVVKKIHFQILSTPTSDFIFLAEDNTDSNFEEVLF